MKAQLEKQSDAQDLGQPLFGECAGRRKAEGAAQSEVGQLAALRRGQHKVRELVDGCRQVSATRQIETRLGNEDSRHQCHPTRGPPRVPNAIVE